jgi:hypothetical protein
MRRVVEQVRQRLDEVPAHDDRGIAADQLGGCREALDTCRLVRPQTRLEPPHCVRIPQGLRIGVDTAAGHNRRQRGLGERPGVIGEPSAAADRGGGIAIPPNSAAGELELHVIPIRGEQQSGAGTQLDEDEVALRRTSAYIGDHGSQERDPVHLVRLRAALGDGPFEARAMVDDSGPNVRPRITCGRHIGRTDDAGEPPSRGQIGVRQHQVVDGGQEEDRPGLPGARVGENRGDLIVLGRSATDPVVERQVGEAGGEPLQAFFHGR